jgi:hypothetical protein
MHQMQELEQIRNSAVTFSSILDDINNIATCIRRILGLTVVKSSPVR